MARILRYQCSSSVIGKVAENTRVHYLQGDQLRSMARSFGTALVGIGTAIEIFPTTREAQPQSSHFQVVILFRWFPLISPQRFPVTEGGSTNSIDVIEWLVSSGVRSSCTPSGAVLFDIRDGRCYSARRLFKESAGICEV